MKPFYQLLFILLLSWNLVSPFSSSQPTLGRNSTNNLQCIDTERVALLQFKRGITNDTCGMLTSWEPHINCCEWDRVVCSDLTGHVITLSLDVDDGDNGCLLEGKVSHSLGELAHLKRLNLSNNLFYGEIPDVISSLNGLQSLDLSNNKLKGNIPLQIGNLTALEFLDLSDNHLTGGIPTSLAEVTALGTLDVSNNNLSGEIPVGTQLQSFNASSYAGNPGLCGAPLPSCLKDRGSSNVPNGDGNTKVKDKDDDDFGFFLGAFISATLGFIFGFWVVHGYLTSRRQAYNFRFLENIKDMIMF